MSSTTQKAARSALSFVFGALAILFGVAAALAVTESTGSPVVIGVEVLITALFGALCVVTGKRR